MSDLLNFLPGLPLDREDRHWATSVRDQAWEHCFDSAHEALAEAYSMDIGSLLPGEDYSVVLIECEPNPDAEDPDGMDSWRECNRHELRIRCVVDTEERSLEHQLYEAAFYKWASGAGARPEVLPSKVRMVEDHSGLGAKVGDQLPAFAVAVRRGSAHKVIAVGCQSGRKAWLDCCQFEVVEWRVEGEGDV